MGEDRVKTALERAMERAEGLGKITGDEIKRLEFVPVGTGIAARYLREEGVDLEAELAKSKGSGNRKWVLQGAQDALLANISLPRDTNTKNTSKKALEGFALTKENKKATRAVVTKIETLFNYYEQARAQMMRELRKDVEARVQEMQKNIKYQVGSPQKLEMEMQQQLQEEMRAAMSQLDGQYEPTLREHKKELLKMV